MRSWDDWTHDERAIFLAHLNQYSPTLDGHQRPTGAKPDPGPPLNYAFGDALIELASRYDKHKIQACIEDLEERQAIVDAEREAYATRRVFRKVD